MKRSTATCGLPPAEVVGRMRSEPFKVKGSKDDPNTGTNSSGSSASDD